MTASSVSANIVSAALALVAPPSIGSIALEPPRDSRARPSSITPKTSPSSMKGVKPSSVLPPLATGGQESRSVSLARTSIGRGEIRRRSSDIGIIDRCAVDLDHLGHLGLPEVLLELRAGRLGLDVVGRVAGAAIALHDLEVGAGLELAVSAGSSKVIGLALAGSGRPR